VNASPPQIGQGRCRASDGQVGADRFTTQQSEDLRLQDALLKSGASLLGMV
jgi:hypothetical protein